MAGQHATPPPQIIKQEIETPTSSKRRSAQLARENLSQLAANGLLDIEEEDSDDPDVFQESPSRTTKRVKISHSRSQSNPDELLSGAHRNPGIVIGHVLGDVKQQQVYASYSPSGKLILQRYYHAMTDMLQPSEPELIPERRKVKFSDIVYDRKKFGNIAKSLAQNEKKADAAVRLALAENGVVRRSEVTDVPALRVIIPTPTTTSTEPRFTVQTPVRPKKINTPSAPCKPSRPVVTYDPIPAPHLKRKLHSSSGDISTLGKRRSISIADRTRKASASAGSVLATPPETPRAREVARDQQIGSSFLQQFPAVNASEDNRVNTSANQIATAKHQADLAHSSIVAASADPSVQVIQYQHLTERHLLQIASYETLISDQASKLRTAEVHEEIIARLQTRLTSQADRYISLQSKDEEISKIREEQLTLLDAHTTAQRQADATIADLRHQLHLRDGQLGLLCGKDGIDVAKLQAKISSLKVSLRKNRLLSRGENVNMKKEGGGSIMGEDGDGDGDVDEQRDEGLNGGGVVDLTDVPIVDLTMHED